MRIQMFSILAFCLSGCVHTQLQHATIGQSDTISEIYEQQVLNNLAKFAVNPEAVPDFAIASSGSAKITDTGRLNAQAPLSPFFRRLGIDYSRSSDGTWALLPVSDSERLRLMKCAYQRAVGYTNVCSECELRESAWNRGTATPFVCCEIQPCCYRSGKWCEVPKDDCALVGEYCGTYVWIPHQCRAHFSTLVLQILEYAVGRPAEVRSEPRLTKQVKLYVDKSGKLADEATAAEVIVAEVPISSTREDVLQLLGFEIDGEKGTVESRKGSTKTPEQLMDMLTPNAGELQFNNFQPRPFSPFDQRILFDVNAPP